MGEGNTGNQERNIMIMFLSNLHYQNYKQNADGSREVIEGADYMIRRSEPGEEIISCVETNEAPLKDVLATLGESNPLHAVFYFATKKVRAEQSLPYRPAKEDAENVECYSEADFFWKGRVQDLIGESFAKETKLIQIDFDEDNEDPVGGSISAVTTLENKIREYLREQNVLRKGEFPLKNCNLYVDITGGMRTANMVMSAAMQLLRYEGAALKRVVYSDFDRFRPTKEGEKQPIHPVSNVQPINDMYQLVAGVDAFTKYGSSAALNEYFADVINNEVGYQPLKKMLFVMDKFSASVLLCQTNLIKKNLAKLMRRLYKFMKEKSSDRPAKVELFARMTNELVHRYSKMLPDMTKEPDEIEIIQWCVDNSLIQQALTLCTEWLPEYLIDHGVIYTNVLDIQQHCDNKKSMGDNAKKHFVKSFVTQSPNEKEIDNSAAKKAIKDIINGNDSTKAVKFALPVNFASGFSALMKKLPDILTKWKDRNPIQSKPMRSIIEKAQKDRYALNIGDLRSALHKWANKEFDFYIKLGLLLPAKKWQYEEQNKTIDGSAHPPKLWVEQHSLNAEAISRNMLHGNVIQSDLPMEEALEYIRGYTYIKADLRNNINHANGNIKLNKVKNELNEYLVLLRKIRDRKHIHTGLWTEDASKEAIHRDRFRFCEFLQPPVHPMVERADGSCGEIRARD